MYGLLPDDFHQSFRLKRFLQVNETQQLGLLVQVVPTKCSHEYNGQFKDLDRGTEEKLLSYLV
jgi:hypothetical protein